MTNLQLAGSPEQLSGPPVFATIKATRRTGHAIVTVTRGDRTRRYRVSLARLYWLRFRLIICNPRVTCGAWLNGGVDCTIFDKLRDDASNTAFQRAQWRDFVRRNRKRLPSRYAS